MIKWFQYQNLKNKKLEVKLPIYVLKEWDLLFGSFLPDDYENPEVLENIKFAETLQELIWDD